MKRLPVSTIYVGVLVWAVHSENRKVVFVKILRNVRIHRLSKKTQLFVFVNSIPNISFE